MAGHAAGVVRPCHYGKTRLSERAQRAVRTFVDAEGYKRAVKLLGTSEATLDKALHGLAMLAVTAERFEARFAPGSP